MIARHVVLACAAFALPVSAQDVPRLIAPAELAGTSLEPQTDTMDIVLVREGARRSGGRFIVTLSRATIDGRAAYLAVTHDVSPEGASTHDTTAVDAATFAPLWQRTHAPADSAAVTYRDRVATGFAAHQNQAPDSVNVRLSSHALEAGITPWIVGALPWQAGYSVSIASFNVWEGREDTTTYRVVGSEALPLRNGAADTWVIQHRSAPNDRAVRKLWIDKRTGRTLQSYDAPPRVTRPGDGYWKISRLVRPAAR